MSTGQLSYINCLVPDILHLIFIITIGNKHDSHDFDGRYGPELKAIDYPILLSSVCSRWRRLVVDSPELWSHINLKGCHTARRPFEYGELYIQRSQNSPLRIYIGELHPLVDDDPDDELEDWIAALLATNAPRIQSVNLCVYRSQFSSKIFSFLLPKNSESNLRRLQFETKSKDPFWSDRNITDAIASLRVLNIRGPFPEHFTFASSCRHLVELYIVNITRSYNQQDINLVQVLKSNPGLRILVLEIPTQSISDFNKNPSEVHLPELQYLRIASLSSSFIETVLFCLFPGSEDLEVCVVNPMPYNGPQPLPMTTIQMLVTFFRRARVTVFNYGYREELFVLLSALPHLQHLILTSYCLGAARLSSLKEATSFLPNLHTVDLDRCTLDDSILKLKSHEDWPSSGSRFDPVDLDQLSHYFPTNYWHEQILRLHSHIGFVSFIPDTGYVAFSSRFTSRRDVRQFCPDCLFDCWARYKPE